ncbi:MAG: 3-hydroxyacyl-CoA dehydrogenase family protein [Candidatus Binatia bacterium]
MAKNSVIVVGKNRLAHEMLELCQAGGFEAKAYSDSHAAAVSAALVVETYSRDEAEKKPIIQRLDAQSPSATILTSCLGFSATRIASWITRPERVVGFAAFYPLKDKKVIELSSGLGTHEPALEEAEKFFRALGKEPVRVKDAPGLIFARILSLIINEAARSLDEGVAQAEEIDTAMRLGVNYPSGPLKWADRIGLDDVLAVLEGLQRETGEDRYRPSPLLVKMVLSGRLGESSGRGFYEYTK